MEKNNKTLNVPNLRFPEFSGEWESVRLGDVCKFFSGGTPSSTNKDFYDGDIPFIRSGEIHSSSTELYISEAGLNSSSAKIIEQGDLLLALYGATSGDIAISKIKGAINQAILCIRTNHDNFFLKSCWEKHCRKLLQTYLQGGQGNLSADIVKSIKISFPSCLEQKKISGLLALVEERIETQKKIIEDLKKLKDAISCKNLFDQSWKEYKVSEISILGRGRVISTIEISRQERPQYPVYSSQTSNNGIMGYLDDYDFDGEYITWTTDGANAGTVFYRNGRFNCTNVCGTIKVNKNIDAYFLSVVLQSATAKYVSINLANPKLMNNTMASIKVKLPDIDTQKYWSRILQHIDKKIDTEFKYESLLIQQKIYLLSQLFI